MGDRSASRWILLAGFLLFFWGRLDLPPGQFSNADVAGMTYNADLLVDGKLPYVASIEGKAPGTFFITALVFRFFGRSVVALWWVFFGWQLLGAAAIWVGARQFYGRRAVLSCSVATAIYLSSAGQFDLNYTAWMTTAYAWAFTSAVVGLNTGKRRWHFLAGLCAIAAFLLKRQAVMLVPFFPILFLWARKQKWPGAIRGTWGWWALGAFVGPMPLALFYAAHGHLTKLITSVLPVEAMASYWTMEIPISWLDLSSLVLIQCFGAFPLAVSLCLANLIVAASERRRSEATDLGGSVVPLLAFIALSMLAGALGGPRYYTHYLIQYLPGLALLAARPGLLGFLKGARTSGMLQRTARWFILIMLLFSAGWHTIEYATGQASRRDGVDLGAARQAGLYIAEHTTEDETIMVWGWTAWPTYFWADRKAPVMGYKSLGLLTDPNTNSRFFPSKPIRFRPGVHADALMKAFVERPPAYFVYSSYFRTHLKLADEPLFEWKEFLELIDRDYELEQVFGEIRVLGLRGRSEPKPD